MTKTRIYISLALIAIMIAVLQACSKLEPQAPDDSALLDGPVEGLTYEQNARFLAGDRAFNTEIFTPATGLGPLFVATSCGACHAGDGKGTPFTTLTRFGQVDSSGNTYLTQGGPQLQHLAIPGFQAEVIPNGVGFSKFTPPANTGLGFLEAVPDAVLLAMADPYDANGDGISGVPNWVNIPAYLVPLQNAVTTNGRYIGRFGKKAGAHNLLLQTVNAYNQDMGINSDYENYDTYTGLEVEPEVTLNTIGNVVFYLQTLKAPIQRNTGDATVVLGKQLFINVGCEGCHKQTLVTGNSPIAPLANKEFHPYTDLLMHDMGAALDDGYTEGTAKTYEWRTPPLWGLGLSPNSQGGQYFLMHDGRATTLEQAIQLHGGEAENSKNNFNNLSPSEKDAVIKFLKSL